MKLIHFHFSPPIRSEINRHLQGMKPHLVNEPSFTNAFWKFSKIDTKIQGGFWKCSSDFHLNLEQSNSEVIKQFWIFDGILLPLCFFSGASKPFPKRLTILELISFNQEGFFKALNLFTSRNFSTSLNSSPQPGMKLMILFNPLLARQLPGLQQFHRDYCVAAFPFAGFIFLFFSYLIPNWKEL